MTQAKAQVLQWVVRDLGDAFPGIESISGVCGGEPCIARTRVPVWVLVQARQLGTSEADLLRCYPTLRAEDLANAWAYFRTHRDDIQADFDIDEPLDRQPAQTNGPALCGVRAKDPMTRPHHHCDCKLTSSNRGTIFAGTFPKSSKLYPCVMRLPDVTL